FVGTEGAIDGTVGMMLDYPVGKPDTIAITSSQFGKGNKIIPTFDERWIPDAFVGTMASLMEAIETNATPKDNSTEDNLNTLRIVHACYISAAENRSVRPSEVQ